IIGLLSIVELGIGSAIIFSLYKPFSEDNKEKIKGYLEFYSKFYKIVGFIILIVGLLITPFLDVFIQSQINTLDSKLYFIVFLINTCISYLYSYKLCILTVAQDGYKISITTTISKLLISIFQYILLKLYPNFYIFILIQLIINYVYYVLMNNYINKKYKWINETRGNITKSEKESLIKNVKALFFHKIGGVIVLGTDNLIISSFINLTVVGIYNSYYMIIGAVQTIISSALSGVSASVGNLLTEGNNEHTYLVHKRLFFLSFWIVSFVTISLFNTIEQFVFIWLGKKQILDKFTISIVLLNTYFILMRGSVERFKEGSGIYHQDRYAPIIEATINLISSIILVNVLGLPGVFLGTLISNISIIFWIKPLMVYKYVFNTKLSNYFKMYFQYLLVGVVALIITNITTIPFRYKINIGSFGINCIINILVINLFYFFIFRKKEEFLYFYSLVKNLTRKNRTKTKLKLEL
ncbi:lipopolysaccharide biosynthesis protein, partial [Neobacillus vireti]|uniref:lipopolysaccharide biosynthesis protein n=1 Tax=Neobacillus vireti TaxID=220686 RepID=UPI002FFFAA0C